MNGFTAFKLWVAMREHFTTKSFDIFTNRGKMKGKFETYLARPDAQVIEQVAIRFTPREFVLYLAANFIYGNQGMLWDDSIGIANYNLFIARKQQLSHVVENDIQSLYNLGIELTDGANVIRTLTRDQITFETVSLINQYHNITDQLRQLPIGEIVEPLLLRIDKSKGFIKPNVGVDKLIKTKLKI